MWINIWLLKANHILSKWFQAAIFYKDFSIHHTSSDNLNFDHFNYKMEENFEQVEYPQICGQCRTGNRLEISYFD